MENDYWSQYPNTNDYLVNGTRMNFWKKNMSIKLILKEELNKKNAEYIDNFW